jgi:hypothetical protein
MTNAGGRVGRLASRLPEGLLDAAWLWLVLRIGLGAIAGLLVMKGLAPPPCNSDVVINHWTTIPPLSDGGAAFPLVGVWQHWDACWYTKIAAYGYETGTGATTFFPLLPVLMRAGSVLTGGNLALAGLVVNAVALIIAFTGLRQLVSRDFDGPTADRTVLYVAVFPAAFFLFAPFTEAIFLACAVWAILGARRRQWAIAIAAGLLAGFVRPTGILLFLPVGWEAAMALRESWRSGRPGARRLGRREILPVLALLVPVIAYAAFIGYTSAVVGEDYFAAHSNWAGTVVRLPWDAMAAGWDWALGHGDPFRMLDTIGLIVFSILAIAGLRIVPASYSLYTFSALAVLFTQTTVYPLMSSMRYLLMLFPCFVILALLGRWPRLHTAWLIVSLLLLGFLTTSFVRGSFVG